MTHSVCFWRLYIIFFGSQTHFYSMDSLCIACASGVIMVQVNLVLLMMIVCGCSLINHVTGYVYSVDMNIYTVAMHRWYWCGYVIYRLILFCFRILIMVVSLNHVTGYVA